jgi:hypothetical protein
MARTHEKDIKATGETLLVPQQKWAEAGSRITGNTGKSAEDERESEGSTVVEKRSNVRGAKRPCCL